MQVHPPHPPAPTDYSPKREEGRQEERRERGKCTQRKFNTVTL